ncbi:MAG: hypothetical protein HRT61_11750 [Ekhidna sp.]|nr:hypothetical protein [Ekhidna sp.]
MSGIKTIELKSPKLGAKLAANSSTEIDRIEFAECLANEGIQRAQQKIDEVKREVIESFALPDHLVKPKQTSPWWRT